MRVQAKEMRIWLDRKDSHEQFMKKVWADILALGLNNQIDISMCGSHMNTDGWISIWLL